MWYGGMTADIRTGRLWYPRGGHTKCKIDIIFGFTRLRKQANDELLFVGSGDGTHVPPSISSVERSFCIASSSLPPPPHDPCANQRPSPSAPRASSPARLSFLSSHSHWWRVGSISSAILAMIPGTRIHGWKGYPDYGYDLASFSSLWKPLRLNINLL